MADLELPAARGHQRSKKTLFASEQDRPDVARRRALVEALSGDASIRPAWSSSTRPGPRPTWRRSRGWAPRGERLMAKVPHGHWRTLTFLAALRFDRIDGALRHRRPDQRRELPRLCRAVPRADPQARRHRHHGQSRQPQGQRPSARRSAPPARGSSSCRPTRPTSTRSSRSSPSSRHCCARPRSEPSKPPGDSIGSLLDRFTPARMRQLLRNAGYASSMRRTGSSCGPRQ